MFKEETRFGQDLGTIFAKYSGMNKSFSFIAVLLAAALGAAANANPVPEAQVSSPVEEAIGPNRASADVQNASWEEKRAERRAERERILERLRQSSPREKASVREELSKERNERGRSRELSPEFQKSPRNADFERQEMREDRRMMDSDRDRPPVPEYGDSDF